MIQDGEAEPQRLWRLAEAHLIKRNWREAAASFDAILAQAPSHLPALLKSSVALLQLDHYCEARSRVLRALALANNHPAIVLELARRLRELHEPARLLDMLAKSNFIQCGSSQMLIEMAHVVSSIGDSSIALELVDAAIAIDPNNAQARYLRATQLMFQGLAAEAEAELETSIHLQPAVPQPHWVLSRLRKWSEKDHHVERLRKLLPKPPSGSEAEAIFCNALHNELHDLERFSESWSALERFCRIKRALGRYDSEGTLKLLQAIKSLCTPGFVKAPSRDDAYVPIFIVGMHRSGTTLLERILGGHSLVSDGGETYAFTARLKIAVDHRFSGVVDLKAVQELGRADFDEIGRGFIADSAWRAKGKPYLTEKLPSNFLIAGLIAKAIPNARILHMVRDPIDTCFSNLRTYFTSAAPYSYDQVDLANYFGSYRDLMQYWHSVMPGRMLDVSYDELVTNTEVAARRIFSFCGLPFESEALQVARASGSVMTASTADVRKGILTNRGAAWKPYEARLAPLMAQLGRIGAI